MVWFVNPHIEVVRGTRIIDAGDWLAKQFAPDRYKACLVLAGGVVQPLNRNISTRRQCEMLIDRGHIASSLKIMFSAKSDAMLFKLTFGGAA